MLAETGQTNLTDNPGLTSDEAQLEVDFSYDEQTNKQKTAFTYSSTSACPFGIQLLWQSSLTFQT